MLKVHLRRTLIAAGLACLGGWLLARNTDKIYEAKTEINAGSPLVTPDQNMPPELRRVLLPAVSTDLDSDTNMLKSQKIFKSALERSANQLGTPALATAKAFSELFPMFELVVPESLNQYAPDQMRVVTAQVRAYSAEQAAAIANNIAYSFSDYRKQRAKEGVGKALAMVKLASSNAKKELDRIDSEIREIKIGAGAADLGDYSQSLTQSLDDALRRKTMLESELNGGVAKIASLETTLAGLEQYTKLGTQSVPDPLLEGLRQQLIGAKVDLQNLREIYLDSSTFVIRAKAKVANIEAQVSAAEKRKRNVEGGTTTQKNTLYSNTEAELSLAKANSASLRQQIARYDNEIQTYRGKISDAPGVEAKMNNLMRQRMVQEEAYQKNFKFVSDLQDATAGTSGSILSLAEKEYAPEVAPDVKKYMVLATIVGGLIGLAYSFAAESFRLPVHTSWQLGDLTSLPVSASVPSLPKPLAKRHALAMREPGFKPIESMRYMAFSMMAQENRPHVILFSAVGEEVDSSLAAAEFAIAMSKTGKKTILVDCDLRVPRLSENFMVSGRSGVADILGRTILPGEATDLFVSTVHENLQILAAGSATQGGISDFLTTHLQAMINDLREKSDTVVINCPPVDVFADASRMASYVDHTCMVISAKTTSYRAIPVAQEILEKSGAKSVSLVLTNASATEEPFGTRTGFRKA